MDFDAKLNLPTQVGHIRTYQVTPKDKGIAPFTVRVTASQVAAATPSVESKIASWCRLNRHKLPRVGGSIDIDLNEVSVE